MLAPTWAKGDAAMAQSRDRFSGWEQFTAARVRVLRGLEDQQTEREIAAGLSIKYGTVRRHVEDLKDGFEIDRGYRCPPRTRVFRS